MTTPITAATKYGRQDTLRPGTVKPGDGVTVHLYSDSQSWTVIAVSPAGRKLTIQRDSATRANKGEDTFAPGGFVGHTDHPGGQQWDIEPDPEGNVDFAYWSAKRERFMRGSSPLSAGRSEWYDYNF